MANAMIDLGEVPKQQSAPISASRPPVPYRPLLGALSLLLVALLAGAMHRDPPWPPAVIPGRLSDVTFVDHGRLFVISVGPEQPGTGLLTKIISGYSLPDAKPLSRTTVAVAGSVSNVLLAGDTILVSYRVDKSGGQATVAVTEDTSAVLWRQPVGLVALSAAAGAALVTLDDGNGSQSGWSVVDVRTGVARWSLPRPLDGSASDFGYADGFPRWFVTETSDGHLAVRDALTGAVTATATVPGFEPHGSAMLWTVDDLLVVGSGRAELTAYALPGLTPRWTSEVDLSQSWLQSGCGAVICAFRQQHGVTALDPATGRKLWDSDRWAYAEPAGRYLAATAGDSPDAPPQIWLLDPVTGRVLGNFGQWQGLGTDDEYNLTYAMYQEKYVVWYGELDPDRLYVRILGSATPVSGDCHVSTGALICRLVDASVGVWRLR